MSFTPGALFAGIFFGAIGMAAFVYGKKSGSFRPCVLGIVLMAYPYFIPQTWLLFLIGFLLTAALFVWRE